MKRVARRPALVAKARVKTVRREAHVATTSGPSHFLADIASRGAGARVCVVRSLGGIGDVLMTTPALRELKRQFPKIHLTYAIDRHRTSNDVYFALVKNAPFIDSIIDARYVDRKDYDAFIDISSVCIKYERPGLPAINRIDLFARHMGLNSMRNKLPFYELEASELQWAKRFMAPAGTNKTVVLHTASFSDKRSWPVRYYRELIEDSKDLPITFLVLDFNNKFSDWSRYSNVINCSGTDLRQMAAIISAADLFIGPDSGPMHLAGAVGTKSLVLFGSVPPEARINHYPTHEAIQNTALSCLGCWYEACPYSFKCMKELSKDIVYRRMLSVLGVSYDSQKE